MSYKHMGNNLNEPGGEKSTYQSQLCIKLTITHYSRIYGTTTTVVDGEPHQERKSEKSLFVERISFIVSLLTDAV